MSSNVILKSNPHQPSVISWDDRLHRALDRYAEVKGAQPALIPALIEGLRQWMEHLPYSFQDDNGVYLPVNKWGLGAEYTEIYALVDWLIIENRHDLADSLRNKFEALYRTTKVLDDNFPNLTPQDERTEKRLVKICRRQTVQLISFLEQLFRVAFKYAGQKPRERKIALPPEKPVTSHRKRSHRAAHIELLEKELVEHIKAARDYAWSEIDAGKAPQLLPRPLKIELANRVGIKKWTVCRCFNDPSAHQLRLLWEIADDLEQILRFKKR
jgi:hypothetical protein